VSCRRSETSLRQKEQPGPPSPCHRQTLLFCAALVVALIGLHVVVVFAACGLVILLLVMKPTAVTSLFLLFSPTHVTQDLTGGSY